jgi:hypothetical protein
MAPNPLERVWVKYDAGTAGYSPLPEVLAQFNECRLMTGFKLADRLDGDASRPDKVKEEALVMLARHFRATGADRLAWKVMLTITERVQPALIRAMKLWRLSPIVGEEFVESTISLLYEAILGDTDAEYFWEIKFWVCFERRLLSSLRKYRIQNDRYVEPELENSFVESVADSSNSVSIDLDDPSLRAIIADGLAQLPENLRTAFMLKHWAGFPEHSEDKTNHATISHVMGVSGRSVRYYLSKAEKLLNEWRQDSVENCNEGCRP